MHANKHFSILNNVIAYKELKTLQIIQQSSYLDTVAMIIFVTIIDAVKYVCMHYIYTNTTDNSQYHTKFLLREVQNVKYKLYCLKVYWLLWHVKSLSFIFIRNTRIYV